MSQPNWKFVANLGDVNFLDYGGLLVFVDETGVYAPEMEYIQPLDENDEDSAVEIRRAFLEPCTYDPTTDVLSDNPYHPQHAAWFWRDIQSVADCIGMDRDELIALFTSANPCERANAWRAVGDYHGWDNLDSYPLTLSRAEAEDRYKDIPRR